MRAFFLRRLLVLHKKWFCECEVERPSSSRPEWGHVGPGVLWDSLLHWHRKLGADAVFWKVCFLGVFVLFSQAPSTEHIRPDGGEGYIWKPLGSPCPLLRGHVALRVWWGMALLSSSQQGGGFGSVVEWHLVKKTTKGKWGGLGFHLKNLNTWVKTFNRRYLTNIV